MVSANQMATRCSNIPMSAAQKTISKTYTNSGKNMVNDKGISNYDDDNNLKYNMLNGIENKKGNCDILYTSKLNSNDGNKFVNCVFNRTLETVKNVKNNCERSHNVRTGKETLKACVFRGTSLHKTKTNHAFDCHRGGYKNY
jgi:hypothetical protein